MATADAVSNSVLGAPADSDWTSDRRYTQHIAGEMPSGPSLDAAGTAVPSHRATWQADSDRCAGPLQVLPGGYHLASADAGGTIAVKDLRMLGGALANSASPRGSSARWAASGFRSAGPEWVSGQGHGVGLSDHCQAGAAAPDEAGSDGDSPCFWSGLAAPHGQHMGMSDSRTLNWGSQCLMHTGYAWPVFVQCWMAAQGL